MEHTRFAVRTAPRWRWAWLFVWAVIVGAAVLAPPAVQRAAAMCCACKAGTCGGGFCEDGIAGTSCTSYCLALGCSTAVFDNTATCSGGCGAAGTLPTGTPTTTPTDTPTPAPSGTPTSTPSSTPSVSRTATPSNTPTTTPTVTVTSTPTITLTPSITPTPIQCCDCPTTKSCGQPIGPSTCSSGCTLFSDYSCDSGVGGSNSCKANTPTATVTNTLTVTPTSTPTRTNTATPTRTPTQTPTQTEVIPSSIDPYKCYRIKGPHVDTRVVTIVDQFENKRTGVMKAFMVCNPSLRLDGTAPPTVTPGGSTPTPGPSPTPTTLPLKHPEAHLVCYKIRDQNRPIDQPKFPGVKIMIRDEVEPGVESVENYDVTRSNLVCMPSVKSIVP